MLSPTSRVHEKMVACASQRESEVRGGKNKEKTRVHDATYAIPRMFLC